MQPTVVFILHWQEIAGDHQHRSVRQRRIPGVGRLLAEERPGGVAHAPGSPLISGDDVAPEVAFERVNVGVEAEVADELAGG